MKFASVQSITPIAKMQRRVWPTYFVLATPCTLHGERAARACILCTYIYINAFTREGGAADSRRVCRRALCAIGLFLSAAAAVVH